MPVITTKAAASSQGYGEFTASAPKVYIEDVFSTYLYTGNGSTQTITNNVDLSTKGGLVWIKNRVDGTRHHELFDTARGIYKALYSNQTWAQGNDTNDLTAFNNNGFSIGSVADINGSGNAIASWTFRKQPKFFDVVTYTGNGSNRTISHSLGSVPGCVLIKCTSLGGTDWMVFHRSASNGYLYLNTTSALMTAGAATFFGNGTSVVAPDATSIYLGSGDSQVNQTSATYVAYLFAHDAGGFGLSGTDNVISCGSYTGNGSSTGPTVTLGYEPQWLMIKAADRAQDWFMFDTMRGLTATGGTEEYLLANTSDAAGSGAFGINPTATGFGVNTAGTSFNASGEKYIYIAIRRGPMKVPTSGTSVFSPVVRTGTNAAATVTTGNLPDWVLIKGLSGSDGNNYSRLTGPNRQLYTNKTLQEIDQGAGYGVTAFLNTAFTLGLNANNENANGVSIVNYAFTRAPGFFDVVCYTGTGAQQTLTHNLTVVPELLIVKTRSLSSQNWQVWTTGFSIDQWLNLDTTGGTVTNSSVRRFPVLPTSSAFTVSSLNPVGASAATYVAYLFATCPGVSKVGTYTGTGTTKQIDCGFTGGARFILIKRTDSTGDWYVYDTARGIVSGNDSYLFLNSTAAEVTNTDYVDTYSAGFELSSTAPAGLNASGGSFVFLAIS